MLLQWVLYPLVLIQVVIGLALAAFVDYEVLGFGFIPYSAIAADNENLHAFFLQSHAIMAWVLSVLVGAHFIERWRLIFVDDASAVTVQGPAKL